VALLASRQYLLDNSTVGYGDISLRPIRQFIASFVMIWDTASTGAYWLMLKLQKENTQNKIVTDKKTMYWLWYRRLSRKR
jgi:hypothetical protein